MEPSKKVMQKPIEKSIFQCEMQNIQQLSNVIKLSFCKRNISEVIMLACKFFFCRPAFRKYLWCTLCLLFFHLSFNSINIVITRWFPLAFFGHGLCHMIKSGMSTGRRLCGSWPLMPFCIFHTSLWLFLYKSLISITYVMNRL